MTEKSSVFENIVDIEYDISLRQKPYEWERTFSY